MSGVPDGLIDPKSYYIGYEDGKKAHPVKELTDEEIIELWYEEQKQVIEFAKAILRKAQEK